MNEDKLKLWIDFCDHKAAKIACERWHYSKRIPVNKLVKLGVWEYGKFVGVVIFGVGASAVAHIQYGLDREQVCELVRVALKDHQTPVTRIVSISIKLLKSLCPGIKLITSFADPYQGHHGGIYQGGNWVYTGLSLPTSEYYYNGAWRHVTDVYKRLRSDEIKNLEKRKKPGKHRYLMPLDSSVKTLVESFRKPFPKRIEHEINAPGFQPGEGGEVPTDTLQPSHKP